MLCPHDIPVDERCIHCMVENYIREQGMADMLRLVGQVAMEVANGFDVDTIQIKALSFPLTAHDDAFSLCVTAGQLEAIAEQLTGV